MSSCYVKYGPNTFGLSTSHWEPCVASLLVMEQRGDIEIRILHDYFLKGNNEHYEKWLETVCKLSGTKLVDRKLVFKDKKPNQIHLVVMLARLPLEVQTYNNKEFDFSLLTTWLEEDKDPLTVAVKQHRTGTMNRSGHGVPHVASGSDSTFSLRKAMDDLEKTFFGINDAWRSGIRIGLVR